MCEEDIWEKNTLKMTKNYVKLWGYPHFLWGGGGNQFEVVYYKPGIFGAFLCIQAREKFEFGE